ncbi:MAG: hypothetical protein AAF985_19735 [Bacteroidota bacterium]
MHQQSLIIIILLCLLPQLSWTQGKAELQQHFTNLTNGKKSKIDQRRLEAFRQNAGVVGVLNNYLTSEHEVQQREAIRLSVQIGTQHEYAISRMQMVNQLLKAAEVVESAQLGRIAASLQRFKRSDFDEAAKRQLAKLIKMERPHTRQLIELAGFVQMYEFLDDLRFEYKDNKHLRQSIGMALTRCGDEQKRDNLLKNVAKYRINDEFVFGILPKLVYARQKETTNYLFDIILQDQKTCGSPADHDHGDGNAGHHHNNVNTEHHHGKINCAYRVMEAIAPYVKGIPLQVGASGDLVATDYRQALKTTREWIRANRDNYELNTEVY